MKLQVKRMMTVGSRWLRRTQRSGSIGLFGVLMTILIVCLFALAGCGTSSPSWETLSTSQSSSIISLAQDPSQPGLLYAGSNEGVIYRARTDGTNPPVGSAGLPASAQASTILPDPHASGVVYVATTSGFFVTSDFGDHWSARGTGLPANDSLSTLVFDTNGTLLVGTLQHGVYASSDQGSTWIAASSSMPPGADIYTLFADPATHAVFAGLDGGGVYATSDNGQSWSQRSNGLPPNAHVYAFAETPSKGIAPNGPTLYAGTKTGLYASADGGQTWTQHGTGQGLPSGSVQTLVPDPSTPGKLYAAVGSSVYSTTDGGAHWTPLAPALSHPVSSLLVVTLPNKQAAVFAGAGQIERFPSLTNSTDTFIGNIVTWGFAILLIGVAFYFTRRSRRRMDRYFGTPYRRSDPRDGLPPV